MPFNSSTFLIFFATAYPLYLICRTRPRLQNAVLLGASYVFYGYFQWRFLALLVASTLVDFVLSLAIARRDAKTPDRQRERKLLVTASIVLNLALLGFFKYFNFFSESVTALLNAFGMRADPFTLNLLLPLGISFYTFQKLSYVIDVYRGKLAATTSLLDFALYAAYFPQIAAGPIERAGQLMPQIARARKVTAGQVEAGLFLILWGFFKKLVVADNLALVANAVFDQPQGSAGLDVVVAVVAFAFQIYGDFSGYTDIARGISMLLGFQPTLNFKLPYFSRSIPEFWKRWHISLSNWLTDYVYTPLTKTKAIRLPWYHKLLVSLFITFVVSGLWHGAAWTYVVWGALHGVYMMASVSGQSWRRRIVTALGLSRLPEFHGVLQISWTFALVCLTYVFFRANSLADAFTLLGALMDFTALGMKDIDAVASIALFAGPLLTVDAAMARSGDLLALPKMPGVIRAPVYGVLACWIMLFGFAESMQFIYFQF
jgi:alginate O-acetyltransferase complex protein AlgI